MTGLWFWHERRLADEVSDPGVPQGDEPATLRSPYPGWYKDGKAGTREEWRELAIRRDVELFEAGRIARDLAQALEEVGDVTLAYERRLIFKWGTATADKAWRAAERMGKALARYERLLPRPDGGVAEVPRQPVPVRGVRET